MEYDSEKISFRQLEADDLSLMRRWVNAPHVKDWWHGDKLQTLEAVAQHYTPSIEGQVAIFGYIVLYDAQPVGYIQMCRLAADADAYAHHHQTLDATATGIDLFIGETDHLHQGFAPLLLRRFIDHFIFATDTPYAFIDPTADNQAAIRACMKAGFKYIHTTRVGDQEIYLMWIDRESFA